MFSPHSEEYLITVLCEVYVPSDTAPVNRGAVFKVMRRVGESALTKVARDAGIGPGGGSETWKLVRDPEVFMNGPFERLEARVKELFYKDPISTNASFELKYDEYTDQISRKYMVEHGFGDSNAPWAALARHYKYGQPTTAKVWREKYGVSADGRTGFSSDGYKSKGRGFNDDALVSDFSPEELKKAEESVGLLMQAMKPVK